MPKLSRRAYSEMFGPTTGDRLRLADTELIVEVEKDFTVYGDEVKCGGGKVIRDSCRFGGDAASEIERHSIPDHPAARDKLPRSSLPDAAVSSHAHAMAHAR